MIIGVLAAAVPFLTSASWCSSRSSSYDDALDTFGVHAIGGTLGAFLTGVLATDKVNGNLSLIADAASANPATKNGLAALVANGGLWMEQLKAMGITIVMAIVGTVVIATVVKMLVGLRPSPEVEDAGLDVAEHGEVGYEL